MQGDTIVMVQPDRLTRARSASGYSIREIATRAGVNRSTVGHIVTFARRASEGGRSYSRSGRTTITAAAAIAGVLGHPVADLFTHTNGDTITHEQ